MRFSRNIELALALVACFISQGGEFAPPGAKPRSPGRHALVGAKVWVNPRESLTNATVIVRDGRILQVGTNLDIPPGVRRWDMTGLTLYAGFVEPCFAGGASNRTTQAAKSEPVANLTAGTGFVGVAGSERDPGGPGPGARESSIQPQARMAERFSPDPKAVESLRELGFGAANFVPEGAIMSGTSTLALLSDRSPNEVILRPDVFQHVSFESVRRPGNGYPRSLMGAVAAVRQTLMDAQFQMQDRAHYARHPQGRKRPEFNRASEALEPVVSRKQTLLFEAGSALMAPRASQLAREFGATCVMLACGDEWLRPDLLPGVGAAFITSLDFPDLPKLDEDDDWDALTLEDLRRWDWAPENPAVLRRAGAEVALTTYGLTERKQFRANLELAVRRGLSEADALAALTTVPAKLCGMDSQLGTIEVGKLANLTVVEGDGYFTPKNRVREVWIEGERYEIVSANAATASEKPAATEGSPSKPQLEQKPDSAKLTSSQREALRTQRTAKPPQEGRGPLADPTVILVKGATVWTCGPAGRLNQSDVLIENGKISRLGPNLQAPDGNVLVIDAAGKHLTPGLIDPHNHSMILGQVNEVGLPSTAMVRIADVINSETLNLYCQLAGGVTTVNLLHGSANPIGGQSAVIKLRDGASPDGLLFRQAPAGIKFALGENVKQSNWGDNLTSRFPQTRMGVPTFIANRFEAARRYLAQKKQAEGDPEAAPVRRDLELETIGEILEGKRWIHCHSYRQDEILAFLRTMEGFQVKVGTLEHVLEGYKVADEIARHGAGASTFSDWWAYKYEVIDAIPYAGSLMHERGVLVAFNSDSSELARRLNLEAAKAVKYGGLTDVEALKFVTLNPALQLHLDAWVGSLEPGKDADFVIWSKAPLDSATVCLQTWIEGKKFFDRELSSARATRLEDERRALLQKARSLASPEGAEAKPAPKDGAGFRRVWEHVYEGQDRHCLD